MAFANDWRSRPDGIKGCIPNLLSEEKAVGGADLMDSKGASRNHPEKKSSMPKWLPSSSSRSSMTARNAGSTCAFSTAALLAWLYLHAQDTLVTSLYASVLAWHGCTCQLDNTPLVTSLCNS